MSFLNLYPKVFGLDFSDLSLKIVNLKKKGKFFELASWGETKIKPGIIVEGEIKDVKALSEIIKKSLDKVEGKKIKTKNVAASLPEQKAFLQVIKMPKMRKEELKTAVPFEAENYIPLSLEEVYLDFQVLPPLNGFSNKHLDVLIAALPKKIVNSYVSSLKGSGLFPWALEIESQSVSRALIKNKFSPFPVLIVDFGKSVTSLIVFYGYSLCFTSSISLSSRQLTESIARSLKISLSRAEKLKIEFGFQKPLAKEKSKDRKTKKDVFEAMISVLDDLAGQIQKYIEYYQTHADGRSLKIEKIILCGRGANLKGLSDFLFSQLGIPVEIGNPWINILSPQLRKNPQISFGESLGYTTALGLALRNRRIKN